MRRVPSPAPSTAPGLVPLLGVPQTECSHQLLPSRELQGLAGVCKDSGETVPFSCHNQRAASRYGRA